MSMNPQPIGPIPEDTARVARAAFPKGLLLEKLLEGCKERGYLKVRGRQRTDSTHVLGA